MFYDFWSVVHQPIQLFVVLALDCCTKCYFSPWKQDKQERAQSIWTYPSQVLLFNSYLCCFSTMKIEHDEGMLLNIGNSSMWFSHLIFSNNLLFYFLSKTGGNAVDLFKLFGNKSSVIRWVVAIFYLLKMHRG